MMKMTSLDPDEIKRVKLHAVKCTKCKADLMIRLSEKVCPVCGGELPKLKRS
jgi:rRNA maturation endonuclease Nob1